MLRGWRKNDCTLMIREEREVQVSERRNGSPEVNGKIDEVELGRISARSQPPVLLRAVFVQQFDQQRPSVLERDRILKRKVNKPRARRGKVKT